MIKVKDGYAKLIGTTYSGSADRVLLSNGGDFSIHTGRNNEVNKLVRTDGSGYIQAGWINTTSGNFTGTPDRIYASNDGYIRYMTPANFRNNVIGNNYWKVNAQTTAGTGDIYLEMWRGANASWKMLNTGGILKFQSNYTSSAGSYFDCFNITYSSGDTWTKGNATATGFIKSGSSSSYALTGNGGHKQWSTSSSANTLVARDANQYIYATYYNSNISNEDGITLGSVYVRNNSDNWIRRMSFSKFVENITNSIDSRYVRTHNMMNSACAIIPTYNGETGWHRIATINGSSGYGSYILYLCGNWSYASNTNAIIHIDTMHTTAQLTQVSGIVGYVSSVRLVNISNNQYYVDVYINYSGANTPGTVYCYFLGNGAITPRTTAEKITASVTAAAEIALQSGGRANNVVVNNSDSNSTYRMVWHSGNTLYSTGGIYCNPSTDYLYATSMNASDWFRSSGTTGWYNPTNNCHVYPNTATTYGGLILRGEKGGYTGFVLGTSTNYMNLMDNGTDKGLYQEGKGWILYYNRSNNYVGIRTSSLADPLTVSGLTRVVANGKYLRIGPQNSSHAHYETNATISHWFNKTVQVDGNVEPYGNNEHSSGSSSNRWSNVYSYLGNFAGTVNVSCAYPNIVCNASSGSESNIRFDVGGANKGYVGFHNSYGTFLYNSSAGKYVYINNSGYFYTQSYINVGAGNEKNASNPPYVWGVNGSDNFMRTYATSSLSVGKATNADYATSAPAAANYGGTGSTTKIKIKINSTTSWMLSFVVTIYQGYKASKIMISGYNYGTSYWYEPEAVLLGDSNGATSIPVYFGYDSAWNLWVGFDGGSYTGVSITDVTNGYTQISSLKGLFTISNVSSLTTLQKTVTATNSVNYAANAGTSSNVVVNSSDANSTYRMVWHSGNTLYGTNNIYCNPSTDQIYSAGFRHVSYNSASYLLRSDGGAAGFHWSGQSGQPSWLWGGNSQHTYYVYNPANFRVANADTVDDLHASAFMRHRGWWSSGDSHSADGIATGMYFAYANHGVPNHWGTLVTFAYQESAGYNLQLHGTGDNYLYYRNRSSDYGQKPWKRLADASELKDPANYYWANVKVSTSSSTSTKPTFNTCYTSNWFRSTGSTGWYNESYGGGMYMQDTTYVRTYNNKALYVSNTGDHAIYTAGGFASARSSGSVFATYYNGTWYCDTLYTHGNGNLSISPPGGNLYLAYNRGNTYFGGSTYYINRSGYFNGTAAAANSVAWANVTGKPTIPSFAAKGSATQGVYLSGTNTFATMTYSLKATVNAGTASKLAYYSGANAVSAYASSCGSNNGLMYLNAGVPTNSTYSTAAHAPVYMSGGCFYKSGYKYLGNVSWGSGSSGSIYVMQYGPIVFMQGYISKLNLTAGTVVFTLPSSAPTPGFTSAGWPIVQADGANNDRNTVVYIQYGTRTAKIASGYTETHPDGRYYYIGWSYIASSY